MGGDSSFCWASLNHLFLISILGFCFCFCFCNWTSMADDPLFSNSFTISTFTYPQTSLKPYDWRYIRVDLPPWFSSLSIALDSDVNFDTGQFAKLATAKSTLPLICFRDGSPPVPDFSNKALNHLVLGSLSNGSVRAIEGAQNAEHCYPLEKRIILKLTNEQITPGVWYIGLFNGIGALRTQSKMISRGSVYSYTANVSVEGCIESNFGGQFCNQPVESLSCSESGTDSSSTTDLPAFPVESYNGIPEYLVSCRSSVKDSCHGDNETRVFSLEVTGMAEQFIISATSIRLNGTQSSNDTDKAGEVVLMCYARYGAIALASMHEYSGDINKGPLTIPLPKTGRWYVTIAPVNLTKELNRFQNSITRVCYSLAWRVTECPLGKAGLNCTWDMYTLQTILRKNPSLPFESYYMPPDEKVSSSSTNFPLRPLLSNSSLGGNLGVTWTYLVLDIPRGAAGGNLHFRLKSDGKVGSEIYLRYGGIPSADIWDYYYINKTKSSDGSMFFSLSNSSKGIVDFYILYAREGIWSFGLKHLNSSDKVSLDESTVSISLERCPKKCSAPHGSCENFMDQSGLSVYSYCFCDRTHGGIDCSVEIVTLRGHMWQSISLIGSNAAAILPAYWALRKKAYAEWVIFTASGISSALYHACDVGTWCVLTFRALQFMDFWLSFMAVVSTFVFMAAIDEASKRTIHAAVSILTALMAITGATRSENIGLVIAIGVVGLLVGWLIELSTKYRSLSCSPGMFLSTVYSWHTIRMSIRNVAKVFLKRFRWGFVVAGFAALSMAAVSWKLETSQSYWIWHSIWHVSIYTSSFFFLCSMVNPDSPDTENLSRDYELTRQNSHPRGGE